MINFTRLFSLLAAMLITASGMADVPFKVTTVENGKFADNTTWYTMTIGAANLRISDNADASYIALGGVLTGADADLWCFVGNETDGYQIYNKQAGPTKVLTAPTSMGSNNGGSAYAILKDATDATTGFSNHWDVAEATKNSSGGALGVEGGFFINQHGIAANILNNRDSRLAFWSAGYDDGSVILIEQYSVTYTVDLANGSFTATNASGSFASKWESTATAPHLTFSVGANNMCRSGSTDNFNIYSGSAKSATYSLSAGAEYIIKGYKFTFKNETENTNSITLTAGDNTYTVSNEEQTVSLSGLTETSASFTIKGDNQPVLITSFTVEVARTFDEVEKQTDLFITDSNSKYPYRIPAIAKTRNGDLIAVSDYRICGNDIGYGRVDLVARISSDNGQTWGDEFYIVQGSGMSGYTNCGFGDAAIVADSESDEVLLISVCGNVVYTSATRSNPNRVARFRSHDGGKTWSEFEEITEDIYGLFDNSSLGAIQGLFFGSGRICQSRLVKVGNYYRLYASLAARPNGNRVVYSDDFGETWHSLGSIDISAVPNGDEPKTEELPDGRVIVSSRTTGGRYFNIFTYTDVEKAEGAWETVAFSGADNNGTKAVSNATNGEILILPAKRNSDGAEVYVALQSVPFGSGRANVGIYWKELAANADMSTAANFAADWDGKHQASKMYSAYSTMILQANDSIAFYYEEETYGKAYTNVYKQYSLERITDGKYSYKSDVDRAAFVASILKEKFSSATDVETGDAVGQVDAEALQALAANSSEFADLFKQDSTPQGYVDVLSKWGEAVDACRRQISKDKLYTLNNTQYPKKYLSINTTKGEFSSATTNTDEAQKFQFVPTGTEGEWYLYNPAAKSYFGKTGKKNAHMTFQKGTDNAGRYTVTSTNEGLSVITCTEPEVENYASLHLASAGHIIEFTNVAKASMWKIVPTDGEVSGIEGIEADTERAGKTHAIYDLQGRRLNAVPRSGIYITSDGQKHVVR